MRRVPARHARAMEGTTPLSGLLATLNGEVLLRDGKPTGALPGQLLRGPLARKP
jgi:hypothetical protein